MSYCYLICFGKPIGNPKTRHGQAAHYLGYTSKSLYAEVAQPVTKQQTQYLKRSRQRQ